MAQITGCTQHGQPNVVIFTKKTPSIAASLPACLPAGLPAGQQTDRPTTHLPTYTYSTYLLNKINEQLLMHRKVWNRQHYGTFGKPLVCVGVKLIIMEQIEQQLLLLWHISNNKTYVCVTITFAVNVVQLCKVAI